LGGRFQTVQWSIASRAERCAASLTTERLDALGMTMLAIANERMHVRISDPEVCALRVGTGVALGVHADDVLPAGFSPHARDVQD